MVRKVINRVCYILIGLLISISSNAQNIPDSIYYDSTPKPLNEVNLKAELLKHNIPHADIVLAQAKLETGNFKSKLVRTHNNLLD